MAFALTLSHQPKKQSISKIIHMHAMQVTMQTVIFHFTQQNLDFLTRYYSSHFQVLNLLILGLIFYFIFLPFVTQTASNIPLLFRSQHGTKLLFPHTYLPHTCTLAHTHTIVKLILTMNCFPNMSPESGT